MKFIKEFFNRFGLKTPPFFQVLQKIAIIAGIIASLPILVTQFQTELGIILPLWVNAIASKAALISAAVLWIVAKLPVQKPDSPVNAPNLPFTEAKK